MQKVKLIVCNIIFYILIVPGVGNSQQNKLISVNNPEKSENKRPIQSENITNPIVCNEFKIEAKVIGKDPLTIRYKINTDLPDFTDVMPSLYREVFTMEEGKRKTNRIEYYNGESTTIGNLRNGLEIQIPLSFSEKPQLSVLAGDQFEKISDYLKLRIIVPVRQVNRQFGEDNINLKGKKVTRREVFGELRNIIDESINILYPPDKELAEFARKDFELWHKKIDKNGSHTVTLQIYTQIKLGMSYIQVASIIGRDGVEISHSHLENPSSEIPSLDTTIFQWINRNGSNMNAIFQNGKLIQKTQYGLN